MPRIDDLFFIERGSGGYLENLEKGETPIISSTTKNNGVVGFVDLEPIFEAPCITVDRVTGQSFVQVSDFVTVPDDITVLIPKEEHSIERLFYVATCINQQKWRFNFGRKLTPIRLKTIEINYTLIPTYKLNLSDRVPPKVNKKVISHNENYTTFNITEFFNLKQGDFHAIDKLSYGDIPTVSRVTDDNGIIGYYEKPENAKIYPKLSITISTTSGEAFVQLNEFIATDNVVILEPKREFEVTTLFFIQFMINWTKWRYSYGRQCYKTKFAKTNIYLPTDKEGEIDEAYIKEVVKNCYGWGVVDNYISEVRRYNRTENITLRSSP